MMQDDRKHKNLKLITNDEQMGKILRHPLTNEITPIRTGENPLAIADITRKELKLDKPFTCRLLHPRTVQEGDVGFLV